MAIRRLFISLLAPLLALLALAVPLASCTSPAATPTPTTSPTATQAYPTAVPVPTLSAAELKALLEAKDRPLVYDARTGEEYAIGHVPGSESLPLDQLEARIASIPRDRLVVFYCHGGT